MLQLDGKSRALVVDPDMNYQRWLKEDPATALAPPVFAASGAEAQAILADRSQRYVGIFVNPNVRDPGPLSVIRCAHLHHVGTPIFMLYDDQLPFAGAELERLAVHSAVRKPLSYAQILALVAPIIPAFDQAAALAQAAPQSEGLDRELDATDSEFSPIRIENFLSGNKTFFDLYARLKSGRYIKILQAGDAFSEERITSYVRKGVTAFFIRTQSQASYVAYCDQLSTALLEHASIPTEIKLSQTLNAGEETLKFLTSREVHPSTIAIGSKFATKVRRLTEELVRDGPAALRGYVESAASFDHAVGATFIAGMLLPRLNINLDRLTDAVGLATMFHDVGLHATAPGLEDKPESEMATAELELYYRHPAEGARLLSGLRDIDSLTLYAVYHHHERRDGSGFPKRGLLSGTSYVSEVVGISDAFVNLVRRARHERHRRLDPLKMMHAEVFHGFSYPVIAAFLDVFSGKG